MGGMEDKGGRNEGMKENELPGINVRMFKTLPCFTVKGEHPASKAVSFNLFFLLLPLTSSLIVDLRQTLRMKLRISGLVLLAAVFASCGDEKKPTQSAGSTSQPAYSTAFYSTVDSILSRYYALSEAFVNWDSISVSGLAGQLKIELTGLSQKEAAFSPAEKQVLAAGKPRLDAALPGISRIAEPVNMDEKRHAFNTASQNLYEWLNGLKYDRSPVYLQECNMPFNDTGHAVWLSKTEAIRNPYLGNKHPYYNAGMLECGSTQATIDFNTKKN